MSNNYQKIGAGEKHGHSDAGGKHGQHLPVNTPSSNAGGQSVLQGLAAQFSNPSQTLIRAAGSEGSSKK